MVRWNELIEPVDKIITEDGSRSSGSVVERDMNHRTKKTDSEEDRGGGSNEGVHRELQINGRCGGDITFRIEF